MEEFRRSTALPHLEGRRSCRDTPCYRPHAHDTFSIGVIDEGTSVLTGPPAGQILLRPGDVVTIPAGQVHACNPHEGRWRYQMIHMDQSWAAALTPGGADSHLFAGISVLRRPDLNRRAGALGEVIFADDSAERIEAAFTEALGALDAAEPEFLVGSSTDPELLDVLRPVLEHLRNDEVNPSLDELARLVGMSRFRLIRSMKRATGLSPLAWRQNVRIVRAEHMLRRGVPIVETAHALGFADQSHFHRVFRAHVAASPGVYRG
ncbi:helix-turn-helix transcriptional regulator [Acidipropionibacterium virtanenii]|uniref:Arabinose operon regulatory protein n=1 Tax=Acidipropionibacterium virtanenii TaxID=2057246 RepID=A0A344UPU0_9ACTN|nr:AraC family transcriptional regulator [Acidipropionibacterium virtanenii]AXE37288.1 Arabinose operon regulatory protein [Acidipropionibacterium virtanenii]